MSPRSGAAASPSLVCAASAGLVAAWIAAGSTGLLADPLRIALTWLALLVATAVVWPGTRGRRVLTLCVGAMLGLRLVVAAAPLHELLVVVAVLSLLAAGRGGLEQRVLLICANAAAVLTAWRLAVLTIPAVWLLADAAGAAMGRAVAAMTGKPLAVGATFGGVDFLVLMAALYVGWLRSTEPPRRARAAYAASAIVAAHLLYLVALAVLADAAQLLPAVPERGFEHPYAPPDWSGVEAVGKLLPWNLPALAVVLHVTVLAFLLRWAPWRPEPAARHGDPAVEAAASRWRGRLAACCLLGLALLTPVAGVLSLGRSDLSRRVVVALQGARLDWNVPQHDRYGQQSAGMFGMLPRFVGSLGGEFRVSPDLSQKDLDQADVLLLLYPFGPMPQDRRERIWAYVRRGGALLVVAGPISLEGGMTSSVRSVLAPCAISVAEDVASSAPANWQHALASLSHPAAFGVVPRSSRFFTFASASLRLRWPAWPVVVGRWGWSDPGGDAYGTGVHRLEAGERLGDLVLAAEQRYGRGTVAVVGDGVSLTNEGCVWAYGWTGRLLSYLANRPTSPQAAWRQAATGVLCLCFIALLAYRPDAQRLVLAAFLLAASLAACTALSTWSTRVLPDGRLAASGGGEGASSLAYIDGSHLEAYTEGDWAFDAVNGLALTLMRNGYLTATLPELTRERLERAAIVVSIAPARRFSRTEREILRQFVGRGGILICTVGAEEAAASESLLADFGGIGVPRSPAPTAATWREPEPMGRIRSAYLKVEQDSGETYEASVGFFAAWPIETGSARVDVLMRGRGDIPVAVCRNQGRGKVVVIADTGFAMNKNLEYIGGEPFEGGYENAHFWRWLITRITGKPQWIPPRPAKAQPSAEGVDQEERR